MLAALLGWCVTTEIRAQVIIVPNSLATNDGNSMSDTPGGHADGVRIMQIHDASQFGALSGPSFLTQFAYRPDKIAGPSGPRSATLRIYASTTSRPAAGLSTTFAENLGADNTLVFDGSLTSTTENLPGSGNTRQFDIVFPLTTPFLYNPAAGNLLLDFQFSIGDGPAIRFDGVEGNPTVREIIGFDSATVPTASNFPELPIVVQFTFEAPPLVTIRTSQVTVCWNSKSNLTYQVQYRSDLTTNLWTSLGDCIRSTNSMSCISDPVVAGQPQRFYRVALTNCVP